MTQFKDLKVGDVFDLNIDALKNIFLAPNIVSPPFIVECHNLRGIGNNLGSFKDQKGNNFDIYEKSEVIPLNQKKKSIPTSSRESLWPEVSADKVAYIQELWEEQIYSGGQKTKAARLALIDREKRRGNI